MDPGTLALSRRALALIVVVTLLAGMAIKTLVFRNDATEPTVRERRSSAAGPGPRGVDEHRVPFGFARTRDGALTAAVAFVGLGDLVLSLPPDQAEDALRAMAAASASDAFVATQMASFDALSEALGRGTGPARLRAGVVATKVEGFTRSRARVQLWRVLVLSREGMTSAAEQWATVTYELVWEAGDWRIWSEDLAEGPTPAPTDSRPGTPAALESGLAGFEPYPKRG